MSTNYPDLPTNLPGTHRRYGCSPEDYRLVLDTAIPELVRSGLAAKTRDIAVGAGVSPNHPLLRDTQVLYDEALRYAFRLIWPRPEDLDVERLVPAEAVRSLVRTAYRRHRAHPDAVRLIITENIAGHGHVGGRSDVLESSPVVLQIDRVLMRGQDFGAFRSGISAEDVYVLITSLCCFPASQGTTFHNHYGTDLDHTQTVDGLEKLVCDTVLAFLTTSMPTNQGSSYTHATPTNMTPSSVSASLYTAGDGGGVDDVVTFRPGDGKDAEELMRLAGVSVAEGDEDAADTGDAADATAAAGSVDSRVTQDVDGGTVGSAADTSADQVTADTIASSAGPSDGNGDRVDGDRVDEVDQDGDPDTGADSGSGAEHPSASTAGSEPDEDGDIEDAGDDGEFTQFKKLLEDSEAPTGYASYQGYQAFNGYRDLDDSDDPDDENTADDHIAALYDD